MCEPVVVVIQQGRNLRSRARAACFLHQTSEKTGQTLVLSLAVIDGAVYTTVATIVFAICFAILYKSYC